MKFSFVEFLDKIQNKPRHVRVRVFWLLMGATLLLIISFWLVFPLGGGKRQRADISLEANLGEETVRGAVSIWGALKDSVGAFFEETLVEEEDPVRSEPIFNGAQLPLSY